MDEDQQRVAQILGANVRRFRLERGMTQAQLAEALAVEPNFVQAVEGGRSAPGFGTVVRLARTLGVEPHRLWMPTEIPERNPGRPRKEPD